MNINDALNLLSLSSKATQAEIKKAYKAASLKFHPDRNPAGEKMMIAINEAYNTLKDLGETVTANEHFKENNYAEELNEVLNALFAMEGIIVEICGNWVWISGKTKEHKEDALCIYDIGTIFCQHTFKTYFHLGIRYLGSEVYINIISCVF